MRPKFLITLIETGFGVANRVPGGGVMLATSVKQYRD